MHEFLSGKLIFSLWLGNVFSPKMEDIELKARAHAFLNVFLIPTNVKLIYHGNYYFEQDSQIKNRLILEVKVHKMHGNVEILQKVDKSFPILLEFSQIV